MISMLIKGHALIKLVASWTDSNSRMPILKKNQEMGHFQKYLIQGCANSRWSHSDASQLTVFKQQTSLGQPIFHSPFFAEIVALVVESLWAF